MNKKVAIVYLTWSDEPKKYLVRALEGVAAQTYAKENLHFLVVYNPPQPDTESQLSFIQEETVKMKDQLPAITILPQENNLGFAGGNNVGMQWAIDNDFDYVFLHNADGFMAPEATAKLVEAMEVDKTIGQAQSLVLLYPEQDLINTAGNNLHYLDIGYCGLFRQPIASQQLSAVYDVGYVSGAATIMRVDLLKKFGVWREEFFLFHEDSEYSLRLKVRGFRTVAVSGSIFYHQYEFLKNVQKFYWIERNRHVLKYLFYKWPTIILMLPLEVLYNLGLLVVALKGGWFKELLKVYSYWLQPKNWRVWHSLRLKNLKERKVSDRVLLNQTVKKVTMADVVVPGVVKWGMNLVFTIYYYFLKIVIWW